MKNLYRIVIGILMLMSTSCTEEDEETVEPELKNATIQFENNSGDPDQTCYVRYGKFYPVVFIVSYRDIQADISLGPNNAGFIIVSVEDGEEINIKVQGAEDDVLVADATVSVRTDSRPQSLENTPRIVAFCDPWELQFSGF